MTRKYTDEFTHEQSDDLTADLARLRAENADLRARLERLEPPPTALEEYPKVAKKGNEMRVVQTQAEFDALGTDWS